MPFFVVTPVADAKAGALIQARTGKDLIKKYHLTHYIYKVGDATRHHATLISSPVKKNPAKPPKGWIKVSAVRIKKKVGKVIVEVRKAVDNPFTVKRGRASTGYPTEAFRVGSTYYNKHDAFERAKAEAKRLRKIVRVYEGSKLVKSFNWRNL